MGMSKTRKLVIFGLEDFGQLAYEYFTHDSAYEVVGFCVDGEYLKTNELFGLPALPFEEVDRRFPPADHDLYAAVVYGKLNRIREDICNRAKAKGYRLASYISSRASVWRNASFGEHCFIFEDNTIQPFVTVGSNVVMWSGNHIGHHSRIGNHCFITSHVVVSGWCDVGDYCFLGVNSTLANNTHIGEQCWVSHGSILGGDIPAHSLVRAATSEISALNEAVLFRSLARTSRKRQR
jgi:sugar O-acyltransferase (sialic acid O-acetyltransferase NeuD family)